MYFYEIPKWVTSGPLISLLVDLDYMESIEERVEYIKNYELDSHHINNDIL